MRKRASSAVALAAATALWLTLDQTTSTFYAPSKMKTPISQTYIDDGQIRGYNDMGHKTRVLRFKRASVPTDRPVTELHNIHYEGRTAGGRHWRSEADSGVLWDDNNRLNLEGAVQFAYLDDDVSLTTNQLNIDFREQVGKSSNPVTLTTSNSVTTGTGLNVMIATGRIDLIEAVETIYEPR